MRTDRVLAHARMFFDDYVAGGTEDGTALAGEIQSEGKAMQEYYCYVLLDFVTADRELEELPLAAALVLSEQLGVQECFAEIARSELRLRKEQFEKIDVQRNELLAGASEQVTAR